MLIFVLISYKILTITTYSRRLEQNVVLAIFAGDLLGFSALGLFVADIPRRAVADAGRRILV